MPRGPPPRRGVSKRGGSALAPRLRGTRVVVLPATAVESGLLRGVVPLRRAWGFGCEGAGQALRTAMRLGPSGLPPLGPEATRDPPATQRREAAASWRGNGRAMIRATGRRAALRVEQGRAEGRGLHRCRRESGRAAQPIARVGVRPGERRAIHAVAWAAWPREHGGPARVRRTGGERRGSRRRRPAPPRRGPRPPRGAAALAGTARGWPRAREAVPSQGGQELPRSPTRLPRLGRPPYGGDFWSEAVGTGAGRATLLLAPRDALWRVASPPRVTGCTTAVEARAPRGHTPQPGLVEVETAEAFGHGCRLLPGHGAPPDAPCIFDGHPCSRSIL